MFSTQAIIVKYILNKSLEAAMGVHVNAQSDSDSKYVNAVLR